MPRRPKRDFFICPHCGAQVPVGASACRECGSDEETGWSEGADVWEAGLSGGYGDDDDFDYDEFIERDLPASRERTARDEIVRWGWLIFVLILAVAFLKMFHFR